MPLINVRQGESVCSIAKKFGLFWETIWNHPKNSKLKADRTDPNVLLPGDKLFVPDTESKEVPGSTEETHRFKKKGVPEWLSIQLKFEGQALAFTEYVLSVDDKIFSGKTDKEGKIKHPVSPEARNGKLTVGSGKKARTYLLRLGFLDPTNNTSGIQTRLKNLGYDSGKLSSKSMPNLKIAIQAFQRDMELCETGEADQETQNLLKLEHGS